MKKINGTPWHIGYSTTNDGRRHRSRCEYYQSKDQSCFYRSGKCIGSSQCDYYKEPLKLGEKPIQVICIEDYLHLSKADVLRVNAYDMIKSIYPIEYNAMIDACCIIGDNIAKWHFRDQSKIITDRSNLSRNYKALLKRMNWDAPMDKHGKQYLARQFSEVVHYMFQNIELQMIGADISYLSMVLFPTYDVPAAFGTIKKLDERDVVNYIFHSIYTRYNGFPYGFQKAQYDKR